MHLNYDLKHLICCRLFYIEKTLVRKNMKNVLIERIYEKPDNFIGMFIITELQFDLAWGAKKLDMQKFICNFEQVSHIFYSIQTTNIASTIMSFLAIIFGKSFTAAKLIFWYVKQWKNYTW